MLKHVIAVRVRAIVVGEPMGKTTSTKGDFSKSHPKNPSADAEDGDQLV